MHVKVLMPQIGMTMVEATIDTWLVEDGATVQKGDVIAEISSEKLTNNVEAPASGKITLLVAEGDAAECGAEIASID